MASDNSRREFLQVATLAAAFAALPAPVRKLAAREASQRAGGEVPAQSMYVALGEYSPAAEQFSELSGNGYKRAQVEWREAEGEAAGDIVFPTATGNWGTVTHAAIFWPGGEAIVALDTISHVRDVQGGDTVHVSDVEFTYST
jgi:hypothetical protein